MKVSLHENFQIYSIHVHYLSSGLETRVPPNNKVQISIFAIIITDKNKFTSGK